jgi:hypothetical protein
MSRVTKHGIWIDYCIYRTLVTRNYNNCNSLTDLNILQITTENTKSSVASLVIDLKRRLTIQLKTLSANSDLRLSIVNF